MLRLRLVFWSRGPSKTPEEPVYCKTDVGRDMVKPSYTLYIAQLDLVGEQKGKTTQSNTAKVVTPHQMALQHLSLVTEEIGCSRLM